MGKEKEIRAITAKEARELADSSDYALRHIYKYIRERAEENSTTLEWCIDQLSKATLETIITHLKEDGYTLEVSDCTLVIKW